MFKKLFLPTITFFSIVLTLPSKAVCPVCVVAVSAGVGLSRWFGIDDTVTGVWIGGLTSALIVWTLNWFEKKNWKFKGRNILTAMAYFLLMTVPLVWIDVVGHPLNKLWGVDKLMLGILLGSVAFMCGAAWYDYLKKKNNKAHFPFQKVMMPVASLIALSFIFYLITR